MCKVFRPSIARALSAVRWGQRQLRQGPFADLARCPRASNGCASRRFLRCGWVRLITASEDTPLPEQPRHRIHNPRGGSSEGGSATMPITARQTRADKALPALSPATRHRKRLQKSLPGERMSMSFAPPLSSGGCTPAEGLRPSARRAIIFRSVHCGDHSSPPDETRFHAGTPSRIASASARTPFSGSPLQAFPCGHAVHVGTLASACSLPGSSCWRTGEPYSVSVPSVTPRLRRP
jgi:hypothetical protein